MKISFIEGQRLCKGEGCLYKIYSD